MSVNVRQAVQLVYSLALTNRAFDNPRISTRKILLFVDLSTINQLYIIYSFLGNSPASEF